MNIENEIIESLSKVNHLIDAFLTIGLSTEDITFHLTQKVEITPRVLSRFPPNYTCPETLPIFAFPWGMRILKTVQETFGELFNFSVINAEGQTLYCAGLVIYQSAGSLNPQSHLFRTETRDRIDVSMFMTKRDEFDCLENQGYSAGNRRSRSSFKKDRSRKTREVFSKEEVKHLIPGQVMVPKCLVLISKFSFFEVLKKILMGIFKLIRKKLEIPFECYLSHLFMQVPVPPKGSLIINYKIMDEMVVIKIPPPNELPLFDCNLTYLFQSLPIPIVLTVFLNILMEYNIVFMSNCNDKLCSIAYSFISLLYPFKWSYIFIPILPSQLIDYLYSPVRFIYGINSKYKEEVILRSSRQLLIVDLDEGCIENHDEIILIKQNIKENEPVYLPEHYGKKLAKTLSDLIEKSLQQKKHLTQIEVDQIRKTFFHFFVSIFQDYKASLIPHATDFSNVSHFFNLEDFLHKQKEDKEFFRRFCKTSMFANFCSKNLRPENIDQQMENLLFNDYILSKKNRSGFSLNKKQPMFINDKSHSFRDKHCVPNADDCYVKKGYFFYYTFPEINYEVLAEYGIPKKFVNRYHKIEFPENDTVGIGMVADQGTVGSGLAGVWIRIWIACLWMQEEIERNERVEELVSVLETMKKNNEILKTSDYLYIIERCLEVDPDIALNIFGFMSRNSVLFTNYAIKDLNRCLYLLFSRNVFVNVYSEEKFDEKLRGGDYIGFFNQKVSKRVFNKKGIRKIKK